MTTLFTIVLTGCAALIAVIVLTKIISDARIAAKVREQEAAGAVAQKYAGL